MAQSHLICLTDAQIDRWAQATHDETQDLARQFPEQEDHFLICAECIGRYQDRREELATASRGSGYLVIVARGFD